VEITSKTKYIPKAGYNVEWIFNVKNYGWFIAYRSLIPVSSKNIYKIPDNKLLSTPGYSDANKGTDWAISSIERPDNFISFITANGEPIKQESLDTYLITINNITWCFNKVTIVKGRSINDAMDQLFFHLRKNKSEWFQKFSDRPYNQISEGKTKLVHKVQTPILK